MYIVAAPFDTFCVFWAFSVPIYLRYPSLKARSTQINQQATDCAITLISHEDGILSPQCVLSQNITMRRNLKTVLVFTVRGQQ